MKSTKVCPNCEGWGFFTKFSENGACSVRCDQCNGTGLCTIDVAQTNFDTFRNYSITEMAEFLTKMCNAITDCNKCPLGDCSCPIPANSQGVWKGWLKEENE